MKLILISALALSFASALPLNSPTDSAQALTQLDRRMSPRPTTEGKRPAVGNDQVAEPQSDPAEVARPRSDPDVVEKLRHDMIEARRISNENRDPSQSITLRLAEAMAKRELNKYVSTHQI